MENVTRGIVPEDRRVEDSTGTGKEADTLPTMGKVGLSGLSEAGEEGMQTAAQQWGGRDPLDIGDILYSGRRRLGGIMGAAPRQARQ